ncbi:hypothetical protein V6N11_083907 [Hibiscus sabdariffa]|uniref:Aminotransferase-like plant mobile domain-containing protein n=1 Tax=Hibiscus sabdariffa TaxID=183260 RepID=A0ABR2QCZ4_9ROSI
MRSYYYPRPLMVSDMVQEGGDWGWDRIRHLLPKESLDRIAVIHPPCTALGNDIPQWRWESNCQFSTRPTYSFLAQKEDERVDKMWKKILFDADFAHIDKDWPIRFAITCWLVWKRRCSFIFSPEIGFRDDIIERSNMLMVECQRAFDDQTLSRSSTAPVNHWRKPSAGVADKMAALGRVFPLLATSFMEAPDDVREIVAEEMNQAMSESITLIREEAIPFDPGGEHGVV